MGELDDAREYLESALKLDPGLDYARRHLDELLSGAGE